MIPTLSVERSFIPAAGSVHSATPDRQVVLVRDELLPVHELGSLLSGATAEKREYGLLVVVEAHGSRACLAVDAVLGQQQVVIKSLGRAIGQRSGVAGGAVLGDGRVALILDVAGVLSTASERTHQSVVKEES